jgi:hypothetical protein
MSIMILEVIVVFGYAQVGDEMCNIFHYSSTSVWILNNLDSKITFTKSVSFFPYRVPVEVLYEAIFFFKQI